MYHSHTYNHMYNPWVDYTYHHPHSFYQEPYVYYYSIPHCPTCCQPYHLCGCKQNPSIILPQEAMVNASSSTEESLTVDHFILIGGTADVKLTLEYLPSDSPPRETSSITVNISGPRGVSTWQETPIPDDYNVKSDFATIAPGTKITISVTDTIARLRWCEVIAC